MKVLSNVKGSKNNVSENDAYKIMEISDEDIGGGWS
jgi:hypothetical protein